MNNDNKLIFENYIDGITRTKNALGGHIMSIVKHGIPSKEEFIKIRQELHDNVKEIEARGTPATEEERLRGQEIIAKIKNYRSQHPDDPPPFNQEENAEDMSKSPFHYDAMKDLAPIANKIYNTLRSAGNDEARPEHIEKMAEIILGPQSAYSSVDHYEKAFSGVIELLNHYVNIPMNEGVHPDEKKYGEMLKAHQEAEYRFRDSLNKRRAEGKAKNYPQKAPYEVKPHWRKKEENAEMPAKQFMSLKQFINKGPIQIKKPSKELPSTHKTIHPLAKQDPREGHRDEEAESACIEDLANKHGVSLEDITNQLEMGLKVEMEHTEDMEIAKKIALDHLAEDPHYYTKLSKMEGKGENAEDEGELMTHMKQAGMIPKGSKPTVGPHTTRERRSENEERRLDPKCWKGYHKQGTKLKNGVRVNNCVKNS